AGLEDTRVGTAWAEVTRDGTVHVILGRRSVLPEKSDDRHDLARRAEAALEGVRVDESALHRVQLAILRDPFDGLNSLPLARDGERHARVDGSAVHENGAGATRSLIADLLRSGEREYLTQRVDRLPPRRRPERRRRSDPLARDIGFTRSAHHGT